MTLAIARHARSHFLQASAHSLICGSSCLEHSTEHRLHASAQARHAIEMSGLSRDINSAESLQNSWQSMVTMAVR